MGGGGANSLNSPETGDNRDLETQNQVWENPTYKSFEDYFTDFNITKDTITEEDLTGVGSETNPYVVHSTRGFLWLTNHSLSKIYLGNKFIELACDIVLNEEHFDENGVPYGGDGNVYEWEAIQFGKISINGNFHTIKGMWQKKETAEEDRVGFMGYGHIQEKIKNINFDNIFVKNDIDSGVYAISYRSNEISNCNVLSGVVMGKNEVAGFCFITYNILNCNNYAKVISDTTDAAGLTMRHIGNMHNCNNFGDIFSYKNTINTVSRVAGLVYQVSDIEASISKCNNYGKIYGKGYYVAGIVVFLKKGKVFYCNNYGKLEAENGTAGGIVASVYGTQTFTTISNCSNYGKIICKSNYHWSGEIVGFYGADDNSVGENPLTISCCKGFSSSPCGLTGRVFEKLVIRDCILDKYFPTEEKKYTGLIVAIMQEQGSAEISNISINIRSTNLTQLCFIYSSTQSNKVNIKNISYNLNCDSITHTRVTTFQGEMKIDGCLFSMKVGGTTHKQYYGSDFSGYYVDFKTGKIGLKSHSGKGFYQGKVTEEFLLAKGYEKKAI